MTVRNLLRRISGSRKVLSGLHDRGTPRPLGCHPILNRLLHRRADGCGHDFRGGDAKGFHRIRQPFVQNLLVGGAEVDFQSRTRVSVVPDAPREAIRRLVIDALKVWTRRPTQFNAANSFGLPRHIEPSGWSGLGPGFQTLPHAQRFPIVDKGSVLFDIVQRFRRECEISWPAEHVLPEFSGTGKESLLVDGKTRLSPRQ